MSQPLLTSRSETVILRQHRYHVRHWGADGAPRLFMLHGWMDSSATFQFLVDALGDGWHVIAPDWRGFGDSEWNRGSYYFPDYLADLDALLQHYSPDTPVTLIGHSMGAMIAGLYAGVRPERLTRLVCVEGFGLAATRPEEAPGRYARWLREQHTMPGYQPLGTLDDVAARLAERNPRLDSARARFLAAALTHEIDGTLRYRADPRHKMVNPVLYRLEEAKACWRRIACPVLWVIGGDMWDHPMAKGVFATLDERRACFARLSEVTVPEAGHMIQWEQPERLAEALRPFLTA
ncbi:alpha/beta fold hydrolase [Pseudogulbenkiania ferrooxidans]|uniref:Alpha/beta hydrolase fold protein n=1 Tax=Pseudogulbenkiania ferrooxidans 2002 TaxID=279714 RepID=B9Z664_9NEIS|nr:alpha/beta hydrolase [Pseudogulbenkiania ferrooxidans]EEG07708.1 alpha/beta hydrolase fold protein [Pseudogulbenkiania ferrooxidans 2002]